MEKEEQEFETIYVFFSQKETIYFSEPIQQIQAKIEQDLLENPNDIKNLMILAQIQYKFNKNDEESLRIYKKILMLDPTNVDARIDLELICMNNYQSKNHDIVNECFKIDPLYWRTHYLSSSRLLFDNNLTQALKAIKNAYFLFPNECWISILYAQQLSDINQFEQAEKIIDEVISKNKLDYELILRISYVYGLQNKAEQYLKYIKMAMNLNPKSQKANNNLGYYYRTVENNYDACIQYCEKAIELDKKYEDAYYNLNYCHEMKGDYEKSTSYLKKYIEIRPHDFDVLQELAYQQYTHLKNSVYAEQILMKLLQKPDQKNQYNTFLYLIVEQFIESNTKLQDREYLESVSLHLQNLAQEKGIQHEFIDMYSISIFNNRFFCN